MKKFINYLLIACILISCDKIEDPWGNVIPQTLSAYTPEFGSKTPDTRSSGLCEDQPESWYGPASIETRTFAVPNPSVSNEYIQYWSEGDAISLFYTTANQQYQLSSFVDGVNSDYGHFHLVGSASEGSQLKGDYYYSVYPYKATTSINRKNDAITYTFSEYQHYSGDTYSKDENGMVAREHNKEGDGVLYFKNFCSYLQLCLVDNIVQNEQSGQKIQPKIVKQIKLESKDPLDILAGDGVISYKEDVPAVKMKMGGSNFIILDCDSGVELSSDEEKPSKFWFVLPGDIEFTKGFSISITFTDNTFFEKSTDNKISIARSHIKPMAPFSPDNGNQDIVLTGPIRYKYADTSIGEPYPLSDSFYGVDGEKLNFTQIYDEEKKEWVIIFSGTLKTIGGNIFSKDGPDIEYIKIDNDKKPVDISAFAFYKCNADSIMINNDVISIGESAFQEASTTSLYINGNIEALKTNVGSGSTITNIIVDGSITTIEASAFASCLTLQSVDFNSVKTVGYRAFYQCTSLSTIDLSSVKYIGQGAFRACSSLQSVSLDSAINIDDNAFMSCSNLTSVVISEKCTMIGEGAFCDATNLMTVTCKAVLPPFIKTDIENATTGPFVFSNTHKNIIIYIPEGSYDYYSDGDYFVNHASGYTYPILSEVNWWFETYDEILEEMTSSVEQL